MPASNVEFWRSKFEQNVLRDARVREELRQLGFRVATIWECALGSDSLDDTVQDLASWLMTTESVLEIPVEGNDADTKVR